MNTRSRAGSAEMIDHAFAAPGIPGTRAMGSQLQRSFPVRASYARTTPLGALARWLSATEDPTITRSPTTAGGDVTSYSPGYSGVLNRSRVRSTVPRVPKLPHGF